MYKVGDRIELIRMGEDPDPIEPGATGAIDFIGARSSLGEQQVGVAWDNGRSLFIVLPYDKIRKI